MDTTSGHRPQDMPSTWEWMLHIRSFGSTSYSKHDGTNHVPTNRLFPSENDRATDESEQRSFHNLNDPGSKIRLLGWKRKD